MQIGIRYGLILLFFVSFTFSCDLIKGKDKATNEAVEQELQEINWNTVDELPSFPKCADLTGIAAKTCFENVLTQNMHKKLSSAAFEVSKAINDTVFIDLIIDSQGKVTLEKVDQSALVLSQLPQLDSLVLNAVNDLPKALPAHKRGIPVSTKYVLPVHIKIE
ncbi:hypothetical protein ABN763_07650 [Spongiivirga sp. MCCC 1A20706]|uniref:hypothetical protein n=1 Tax=Spongiivirga sp. MCCC 1A20706 TaxID=3160963 RepID=UPI003977389F